MANNNTDDKDKACVFEAGWGRVFYEESKGVCTAEFMIEDSRIPEKDVILVWRAIQQLIDSTSVSPLVDERVSGEQDRVAFSLSFEVGSKPASLTLMIDWVMSGQADMIIEMGIDFVTRHRDKSVELDLLQGFYHLHPEQIRSMALDTGEEPPYVQQLKFYGLDFEAWPMSVIPTCLIKTGPQIGSVYAEHALAKPLVRTRWGWITLERGVVDSESPEGGVILAVSVYESMRDVIDSILGVNLSEDFSKWYQHFASSFPRIGQHVEIVESDKVYQTIGLALAPRYEKEGWVELMKWLETGALDREIDRFSTALNLSPAQLDHYFERVDYPLGERHAMRSLAQNLLNEE